MLQYDGTAYHGFQRQPSLATVGQVVEEALRKLLKEAITVRTCSRTDAGVHATAQPVNLLTSNPIPTGRICLALNGLLPGDVAAVEALDVDEDFNARRCADDRTYIYSIRDGVCRDPFKARYSLFHPRRLDAEAMDSAIRCIEGTHDFAVFSVKDPSLPETHSTVREVREARCWSDGGVVRVLVRANAFLYRMMRMLVGTLLRVGEGRIRPGRVAEILSANRRAEAGPAVPPQGLCLTEVRYSCEHLNMRFGGVIP